MRNPFLWSLVFTSALVAPAAQAQTPTEFCAQAEPLAKQAQCREDYWNGVIQSVKYMKMNGLVDDDGVDIMNILGSVFNWRAFILGTKTPGWVLSICARRDEEVNGMTDFRKSWACIMENDPDAALMEAI